MPHPSWTCCVPGPGGQVVPLPDLSSTILQLERGTNETLGHPHILRQKALCFVALAKRHALAAAPWQE